MSDTPDRTPSSGRSLQLNRREQSSLLQLIGSLLDVENANDFERWSSGPLQTLFPHAMMICGLAEIRPQAINIRKFIVHAWPLAYLDALKQPDGSFYSPIMNRWNERHAPQLYRPEDDLGRASAQHARWREVFHDYGLRNIASHGVHDVAGSVTSYFNFSSLPGKLDARTTGLLELLTPHMHLALTRALSNVPLLATCEGDLPSLTVREHDVLHWMLEGKTNWEIAQISGRSEHTIKHQVERILTKLGASNRAQAVAKAIALGLIA